MPIGWSLVGVPSSSTGRTCAVVEAVACSRLHQEARAQGVVVADLPAAVALHAGG